MNPTSKITIKSQWSSSDELTSFVWAVYPFDAGEDLNLEHGVTTSTAITNEFLVLHPSVLLEGASYAFRMTATNRYGKLHSGTINVTAGRPPTSGTMVSVPSNGTALRDTFHLSTGNWTSDDTTFPLLYKFYYTTAVGEPANLREFSTSRNLSSTLPVGHSSSQYGLPVGVFVEDNIGATAETNVTLRVVPPSLNSALSAVSEATSDISDSLDEGDLGTSLLLIQASASVLNFVLESSANDDSIGNLSSTDLRSGLIDRTLEIVNNVQDTAIKDADIIESAAVCIQSLTRPLSYISSVLVGSEDLVDALDTIAALANASAAIAAVSPTAATASVSTISNLITGGVLTASTTGSATSTMNYALTQLNAALTVIP